MRCGLILAVVALFGISLAIDDESLYGYPLYGQVLRHIGRMADEIVELFHASVPESAWSLEAREQYRDMVDGLEYTGPRAIDIDCGICTRMIGLLESVVNNGSSYEDVKNATMAICAEVVVPAGYNPDTLCEPILDTYAPHVIYILNNTDKNASVVCEFYGYCNSTYGKLVDYPIHTGAAPKHDVIERGKDGGQRSGFAAPIKMLHITDMHTDKEYSYGSPSTCDMPLCCRAENNGNGSAMYWGDYECNIPERTVNHVFGYILENFSPDLIVYTGDTVQHTVWDQPQDETIATNQWLTERLRFFFPGIPAYYAVGNHDMAPCNLFYDSRPEIKELSEALYTHWQPLSGFTDEQRATFEKGLYYTATPFPGLRILSYNSEMGALDNFYNLLAYEEPLFMEMLQWIEDTLVAASVANEKVIMLGHHPTGGRRVPGYDEFITGVQARFGDVVILHLLGHNHDDKFALVRDTETGATRGVQISSPALTSYTDVNPSLRLFYLDPVTYAPLDMETYHINIRESGNNANPPIKLTYSATGDYSMADATAASFEDLVNRLETDDALFDLFRFNVDTQTGIEGDCNERCKADLLCHLRNADYAGREACEDLIPGP